VLITNRSEQKWFHWLSVLIYLFCLVTRSTNAEAACPVMATSPCPHLVFTTSLGILGLPPFSYLVDIHSKPEAPA